MVQTVKKRSDYIDAARGLAIFTVVYSHICLFCIPEYSVSSAIIDFLRVYFLNAFFFISGFLAYKKNFCTNSYLSLVWKRFYQLLVPALFVGIAYSISHGITVKSFFLNDAKYGYWFTVSLFNMFIIYYTYAVIINRFFKSDISTIIFTVICFGLYFVSKSSSLPDEINNLLCWNNTVFYIPFFSLGLLIPAYKPLVHRIIYHIRGGKIIVFFLAILSCCISLPLLLYRITIVLLIIYIIHEIYSRPIAGKLSTSFRKILLIIGTNSLEIYFLHYFLLFPLPVSIGQYLESVYNAGKTLSTPEFLIVSPLVIVISITTILLARAIKKVPYLSLFAFGKQTSVE